MILPATEEEENSDIESIVESDYENENCSFIQNEIEEVGLIENKSPTNDASPDQQQNEMFLKMLNP